ncbi:hypothetical protein NPIL_402401 [Nephila pilipes]|uniref:Uncharacterized protein n=1 Tax=Nephila pilipes TaxID=299642 RepID=A0A8X6NPD0_NEPPI|nr:hypothetical protein NPIL_402401 [Nephila pilipes]
MSLDDNQESEVEVNITSVIVDRLEGRVIHTPLIALSYAKGKRTLLGMDFLQKAEVIVQEVQSRPNTEENTCLLRNDEDKGLTHEQRNELSTLLKLYETVFEQGGDLTHFMGDRINTGDCPPVSIFKRAGLRSRG